MRHDLQGVWREGCLAVCSATDQRKPRLLFHYDLVRGRLSDTVWHGPAWAVLRDARESAPLDKIGWAMGRASEIREQ
jgi:hypothetical protein